MRYAYDYDQRHVIAFRAISVAARSWSYDNLSCRLPGPPPTSERIYWLLVLLYSQRQPGQPISAQHLRLAARADRAARADLPRLTRQQKRVHISTQSESADTAARTAFAAPPRQLARMHRSPIRRAGLYTLLWIRLLHRTLH